MFVRSSLWVAVLLAGLFPYATKAECLTLKNTGEFQCPVSILKEVSDEIYDTIQQETLDMEVVEDKDDVVLEYSAVNEPERRELSIGNYCKLNECTAFHAEQYLNEPGYFNFCDKIVTTPENQESWLVHVT